METYRTLQGSCGSALSLSRCMDSSLRTPHSRDPCRLEEPAVPHMLLLWDCPAHLLPLTCGDVCEILSLELGLFSSENQDVRLRGSGGRRG